MEKEKVKNKLLYTEDYTRFKLDFCNRAINQKRVKQLENSIQKIGWKCNPILVNEKMQKDRYRQNRRTAGHCLFQSCLDIKTYQCR